GTGSAAAYATLPQSDPEPSIWLEPCAKETEEQRAELENASDLGAQLKILNERLESTSSWDRACAVVRAGKFGPDATPLLPKLIQMLRDEEDRAVGSRIDRSIWTIPTQKGIPLDERIALTKDPNVYQRLFGAYSLLHIRYLANTPEEKRIVETLIETTHDEDSLVRWMAVMVIRGLAFDKSNLSAAVPRLCEMIKDGKNNPIFPLRALVPLAPQAVSCGPLIFDVLINPKKYAVGDDDDNVRSYTLYSTAGIVLGRMGDQLVPLLKKLADEHPYEVIEVLSNIRGDAAFDMLLELSKSKDAGVRKAAVKNMPNVTA